MKSSGMLSGPDVADFPGIRGLLTQPGHSDDEVYGHQAYRISGFGEPLQGRDGPAGLSEYTQNVEDRRKTTQASPLSKDFPPLNKLSACC